MNPEHLIEIEERQRRLPEVVMYALLEVLAVSMADIEQAFKDAEKELGLEDHVHFLKSGFCPQNIEI